jgi:hypothetical protein
MEATEAVPAKHAGRRWRAHRVKAGLDLFRDIEPFIKVAPCLRTTLENFELPGRGIGVSIQNGTTDLTAAKELLRYLIDDLDSPSGTELAFSPRMKLPGYSAWTLEPVTRRAMRQAGVEEARQLPSWIQDAPARNSEFLFAGDDWARDCSRFERVRLLPREGASLGDGKRWQEWLGQGLPLLHDSNRELVIAVEDTLQFEDDAAVGGTSWTTLLGLLPEEQAPAICQCLSEERAAPGYTGYGKVIQNPEGGGNDDDERIRHVELEGFERGYELVEVQMGASSLGLNGKGGIHVLPSFGDRVAVHWSGRPTDPPVLLMSPREEAPALVAPSVMFENTLKLHVGGIQCPEGLQVEGDSSIDVTVGDSGVYVESSGVELCR